jgi:hypothetical protein
VCILSDLKDISGKLSETPWIYEKTVVWDLSTWPCYTWLNECYHIFEEDSFFDLSYLYDFRELLKFWLCEELPRHPQQKGKLVEKWKKSAPPTIKCDQTSTLTAAFMTDHGMLTVNVMSVSTTYMSLYYHGYAWARASPRHRHCQDFWMGYSFPKILWIMILKILSGGEFSCSIFC